MKKIQTVLAVLILGLVSGALPVHAGTVYLPLATQETVSGQTLSTELWISNPTSTPLKLSTLFIPTRTDGVSLGDRTLLVPMTIQPGATFFVNNVVPGGQTGMLEINADPNLVFSSKLVAVRQGVLLSGAHVPIVGSANLIRPGETAQLLGLSRSNAGTTSHVGLINFSQEPATCTARVFTGGGSAVGGTAVLTLLPLSNIQFLEALKLLGLAQANNVRIELSCDREFYAYGVILGHEPNETVFLQPSVSGNSSLLAPGLQPPFVELIAPGNFLAATRANPYRSYQLPVERGIAYGFIEIDFDFFLGGFNTNLFHTIFSLRSAGLFCELTIRGDNSRTFFDTPDQSVRANGPWRAGRNYHIHVLYDVEENVAILEVSEGGQVVQRLEARANRSVLGAIDGSLRLDFSQAKVFDDAFFPLWGSRFSNLEVRVFERQ